MPLNWGPLFMGLGKSKKEVSFYKNSILDKARGLYDPMFHWKRGKQRDKSCF